MKNKLFWVGMLVMVLAFGLVFVSCDNGTGGTNDSKPGPYDGTWANGTDRLVLSSNKYTFKQNIGGNLLDVSKGTFTADLSVSTGSFIIGQTHEINSSNGQLEPNSRTETGNFSVSGNTFTLSAFLYFSDVNGNWTKQ